MNTSIRIKYNNMSKINSYKISFMTIVLVLTFLSGHAQDGPPPAVMPGLEINRSVLIKKIEALVPDLAFKQEKDVSNLPNYMATTSKTAVQLLGKEDELKLAKWTCVISKDTVVNKSIIKPMSGFASILGEEQGLDWFNEQLTKINKYPLKAFIDRKTFNYNRKGELKYDPVNHVLTLFITEWAN